jgi:hypothetical protein
MLLLHSVVYGGAWLASIVLWCLLFRGQEVVLIGRRWQLLSICLTTLTLIVVIAAGDSYGCWMLTVEEGSITCSF